MPEWAHDQRQHYLQHDVADVTMTCLAFPGKARAHIFVSWLHPFKEQKLVVVGSRKMAVFDDVVKEGKLKIFDKGIEWKDGQPVIRQTAESTLFFPEMEPLARGAAPLRGLRAQRGRRRAPTAPTACACCACSTPASARIESGGAAGAPPGVRDARSDKPYFVHESSYVDEPCQIGAGTKIWHFSHVMKDSVIGRDCNIGQNVVVSPGVRMGDGCKIQNNVSLYTGVILEDYVFCGPSMVFTNVVNPRSEVVRKDEYKTTLVKRGASIGANATDRLRHHHRPLRLRGRGGGGDAGRARLRAGGGQPRAAHGLDVPLRHQDRTGGRPISLRLLWRGLCPPRRPPGSRAPVSTRVSPAPLEAGGLARPYGSPSRPRAARRR